MKTKIIVLGLIFTLINCLPALAQEIPSFNLEEIIVESSLISPDDQLNISTVNTKVVKPGKATNLADLLKDVAGIDVQQRAIAGDTQDTVKLRGFDGKRFTVLLDGRPINAAGVMGGCYVDWGTIPLETVEKIEIIKGPKSARYGNTLGGVINIISKKGSAEPVTRLQTTFGSYNLKNYRLDHSGSQGNLSYVITAGKKDSDGYLRNNYLDSKDFSLRTTYTFDNQGQLILGLSKVETERGFIVKNRPGSPNYDPRYPESDGDSLSPAVNPPEGQLNDGSYWKKNNTYYDVTYRQPFKDGSWKISYYKNNEERDEYNYNNNKDLIFQRHVNSDKSYSWLMEVEQKVAEKHNLTYGYEEKQLQYGADTTYIPGPTKYGLASQKMKLTSAYVEDQWQVNPKVGINMGLRYDKYAGRPDQNPIIKDLDGSAVSPKFNLSYKISEETTGYFSMNRAYRTPSMAEFYWWSMYNNPQGFMLNPPFSIIGQSYRNLAMNKALKAEDGIAYELGIKTQQGDKANYKASLFYNDIKDYINFDHAIAPVRPAYNIDKVKIWGLEMETEQKLQPNLTLFANYTYQKTKKSGDFTLAPWEKLSDKLDYRPENKANFGLRYKTARGTEISLSERYVGKQQAVYFTGNAAPNLQPEAYCKLVELPGYWITNLSVNHPVNKDQELSLYIDNLFNRKYEERYGYPMPGTTYGVSYKVQF